MTPERYDELMSTFPRCAQRADQVHGGKAKRAIPDRALADVMARTATMVAGHYIRAYKCPLDSPAIGDHWHLTSKKR